NPLIYDDNGALLPNTHTTGGIDVYGATAAGKVVIETPGRAILSGNITANASAETGVGGSVLISVGSRRPLLMPGTLPGLVPDGITGVNISGGSQGSFGNLIIESAGPVEWRAGTTQVFTSFGSYVQDAGGLYHVGLFPDVNLNNTYTGSNGG